MIPGNIAKMVNSEHLQFKGSLRKNLRVGEDVLRNLKCEFGNLKSSTFVESKINLYENNDRYKNILPKLKRLFYKYDRGLSRLRKHPIYHRKSSDVSVDEFVRTIKPLIKLCKVANCGENALLIQDALLKKGENAHSLGLLVKDKKGKFIEGMEHNFVVFGLKDNAELLKPETWGNKAVIVDSWTSFVSNANAGLRYIKDFCDFDSSKHVAVFENCNLGGRQ